MTPVGAYVAGEPLIGGLADAMCQACITIPARNEEATLARCLDGLSGQRDLQGRLLPHRCFEILLLLNNCTDASHAVACEWQARHPTVALHVIECTLPPEQAHVGTARRLLMDTAWLRLQGTVAEPAAILTTDADTVVAEDWIARNLCALGEGADVVGGLVSLLPDDLMSLPRAVRLRYERDRRYAALVARLEDALDPSAGDRCPRHLDHFGASLACTPEAYAAVGGMPAVSPLEDEAFVDCIRRANRRLRHDPLVRIYTSARLHGRAAVGMARQLRLWHDLPNDDAQVVPSADFLIHRFGTLQQLRRAFETKDPAGLVPPTAWWETTFAKALEHQTTCPGFLGAIFCDVLISEAFSGQREQSIQHAIGDLEAYLAWGEPLSQAMSDPTLNRKRNSSLRAYDGEGMSASSVLSGPRQ